jgi:hypothetical protein
MVVGLVKKTTKFQVKQKCGSEKFWTDRYGYNKHKVKLSIPENHSPSLSL